MKPVVVFNVGFALFMYFVHVYVFVNVYVHTSVAPFSSANAKFNACVFDHDTVFGRFDDLLHFMHYLNLHLNRFSKSIFTFASV